MVKDSGLIGSMDFIYDAHEAPIRCSKDTYPESYINEYTLVYEEKSRQGGRRWRWDRRDDFRALCRLERVKVGIRID